MKDFNDFKSEKKTGSEKSGNPYSILNMFAQKYEGKSTDEMMNEIIKTAEEGRKNGTLKDGDIDAFYNTVYPLLNKSQREMLNTIVKKLKS